MSLFESGHSSGAISLAQIFNNAEVSSTNDAGLGVADIADVICSGGWPGWHNAKTSRAIQMNIDYLEEIRRADIQRVDDRARDPERVGNYLRALARNVATQVSSRTLGRDTGGSDGAIDRDTACDYHNALSRLMVVEDQPAWAPHLRSRSIVRESPKRHFVDPSLAVAALGATPERLLQDLNLMGFLFESLVIRDLRVYAQTQDGRVLHYRDNTDLEVDAIVELRDGSWGAFEVKLGSGHVEQAAANLLRFADRVDVEKCGKPRVLAVITATGYGFRRPDGVFVIPIVGGHLEFHFAKDAVVPSVVGSPNG